jgi:hypothetical protein
MIFSKPLCVIPLLPFIAVAGRVDKVPYIKDKLSNLTKSRRYLQKASTPYDVPTACHCI